MNAKNLVATNNDKTGFLIDEADVITGDDIGFALKTSQVSNRH